MLYLLQLVQALRYEPENLKETDTEDDQGVLHMHRCFPRGIIHSHVSGEVIDGAPVIAFTDDLPLQKVRIDIIADSR